MDVFFRRHHFIIKTCMIIAPRSSSSLRLSLSASSSATSIALVLFGKLVRSLLARLNLASGDDLLDNIVLILGSKLDV